MQNYNIKPNNLTPPAQNKPYLSNSQFIYHTYTPNEHRNS